MRKFVSPLLALAFLLFPRSVLADNIQLGDVSIAISVPSACFEDDSFLSPIRKASPHDIVIHKMYIPYSGIKLSGNKRYLLDYILITTLKGSEKSKASAETLAQLETIRDKRYDVANQKSHGYSREENRQLFEALANSDSTDGVFLEKDAFDGAMSYYTLMDTRGKEYRVVSATTFLVINGRLLTLGVYSRIRGKAIYNSLKIVKSLNKKIVTNLIENNS